MRAGFMLLLPLPAIAVGLFAASSSGVAPSAFVVNFIAFAIGALTLLTFARSRAAIPVHVERLLALVVLLVLAATLLHPGLDGVRRWVPIGPLKLHASSALAPLLLWVIARAAQRSTLLSLGIAAVGTLVHLIQPDAGQATAFGLATVVAFALSPGASRASRTVAVALGLLGILLAWRRLDPLAPVAHVEGILRLAFAHGVALGVVGVLALALLLVPAVRAAIAHERGADHRRVGATLGVYLATTLVVPFVGNFPVPVMGAGAGPVLGWFAVVAALMAIENAPDAPPPEPAVT